MRVTAAGIGLWLAIAAGGAGIGVAPAMAQDTVVVATFNTEFLTRRKVHLKFGFPFNLSGIDAALWGEPGFRDQQFSIAADSVAKVLAAIDADVLALTEIGDETDVAELAAKLNALGVSYPHSAVCACTDHTTAQHVAVLSKLPLSNVIPIIPGREHYYEELDDPEGENDTGVSKGMRVSFAAEGQTFHMYVVHLASERGGHEQDQQRISQASIIRRHYLHSLKAGEHVIVAGDLNDGRAQPTIRRIRGFDDIDEDLIQTGSVRFFDDAELDTRWTNEFQGVRAQIDHVLISRSVFEEWRVSSEVPEQMNELASDHRPFVIGLVKR